MQEDLSGFENRKLEMLSKLDERRNEILADESFIKDAPAIEKRFHQWEEYQVQKEKWGKLAVRYHQLDVQRQLPLQHIAAEQGRLQAELNNLHSQIAEMDAVDRELQELEKSLPVRQAQLLELRTIVETRPILESEIRVILESTARLESENARLKISMMELRERIDQLKVVEGADCPLCGQALTDSHRLDLLASLENEGKIQADTHRTNQQEIKRLLEKKLEFDNQLKTCDQALVKLQDVQRTYDQDLTRQILLKKKRADGENTQTVLQAIQTQLTQEKFAPEQHEILSELDKQIESLGYDSDQYDFVTMQEVHLRPVVEQRQLIAQAKSHLEPLKREVGNLQKQLSELDTEIARRTQELETSRSKLTESSAGLPDLEEFRRELSDLKEQETRLITEMGSARQLVQVLDALRIRKVEYSEKRENLALQVSRYKTLEKAFGKDGVQALLIEEALPEIETQANEILDRLSGGSMSVQFATQKDYKDKNRDDKKETLDILIGDGAGVREYELFSGGEAFRVNFAIRLALSRVLAHRAGARLQTLVIDEGFGSQDVDGRQRLIETINLVQPDFAKILVITHLEELKEAFPARIEVEKTLRGSQVSVAI
jgi:exonuclease SbcC